MFSETNNTQVEGRGTFCLNPKALKFFLEALKIASGDNNEVAILEVGAGNGFNTKTLRQISGLKQERWISTDLVEHKPCYINDMVKMSAVEAIEEFGDWNTLLMVSPTPDVSWSMDAIKKAMETKEHFHIIFIGEMGFSDGSPMLDLFMDDTKNGFRQLMKECFYIFTEPMHKMMSMMLALAGERVPPDAKFVYLYEFNRT